MLQPMWVNAKTNRMWTRRTRVEDRGPTVVVMNETKTKFTFSKGEFLAWQKRENSTKHSGSFHKAMRSVLTLAQCFAVMPVAGVRQESASMLRYTPISVSSWYSFIVFFFTIVYMLVTVYHVTQFEISPDSIVPIMFFVSISYIRWCFGVLANRWPTLMQQWERTESNLPAYHSEQDKQRLASQIKNISIVILTLSLLEHILNIVSLAYQSHHCNPPESDALRNYFMLEQAQLYAIVDYSLERAILCKILTVITTFMWSYMDVFVMLISVGLATRFRQITDSLMRHRGEPMPEQFWIEHRQHYRNLCNLCETVDTAISKITLLSFVNNLFFVCIQLLRSLDKMKSIVHAVYFWFSLIFLICRTLAVSLYMAAVHDESRRPISVFRVVPREAWCPEVKRFYREVSTDQIALSGMKFFHVTRRMVMSIAGTIVTYELVLLQFRGGESIELCK